MPRPSQHLNDKTSRPASQPQTNKDGMTPWVVPDGVRATEAEAGKQGTSTFITGHDRMRSVAVIISIFPSGLR